MKLPLLATHATLALAALAACGGPAATAGRPAGAPPLIAPTGSGAWQPSVAALLGERDRLELTSAQVASLDSLSRAWGSRQDSLARAARAAMDDESPPSGAALERARPIFQAITANNRGTAEAVGEVLDAGQREVACRLEAEQRETARAVRGRSRGAPARGGWPWCPPPAPG